MKTMKKLTAKEEEIMNIFWQHGKERSGTLDI